IAASATSTCPRPGASPLEVITYTRSGSAFASIAPSAGIARFRFCGSAARSAALSARSPELPGGSSASVSEAPGSGGGRAGRRSDAARPVDAGDAAFATHLLPVARSRRKEDVGRDLDEPERDEDPRRPGRRVARPPEPERREWRDLGREGAGGVHQRPLHRRGAQVARVVDLEPRPRGEGAADEVVGEADPD